MTIPPLENAPVEANPPRGVAPWSTQASSISLSPTESTNGQEAHAVNTPGTFSGSPQLENNVSLSGIPVTEETIDQRIERLGRQRPEVFDSVWAEIVFVFSICMAQVLTVSVSHGFLIGITALS